MTDKELPKIALAGYGSMGHEIEKAAAGKGFIITDIFEIDNKISEKGKYLFDVIIDFTHPASVLENIKIYTSLHKNIVLGTTGWHENYNEIRELVEGSGTGLIYSSNFSAGMQVFMKITRLASSLVNRFDDYDLMLQEIHHKRKKDSPSGTALTLAKIMLEETKRKTRIQSQTLNRAPEPDEIHISSLRGGEIAGIHTIYLDSAADTIEITHRAKNRSGFAAGALIAAEWIHGKKGFLEFGSIFNIL